MRREYVKPEIQSQTSFETSALGCGKLPEPPPGSWHFSSPYDTFTGHFGPARTESVSGSIGVGFGPGGTSMYYGYSGLCSNWITYAS